MTPVDTHPVQIPLGKRVGHGACAPQAVTMAAYEVYTELYGEQAALVTGGCRGGFSVGELVAFLYARPFPRSEWRDRVSEAINGMRLDGVW